MNKYSRKVRVKPIQLIEELPCDGHCIPQCVECQLEEVMFWFGAQTPDEMMEGLATLGRLEVPDE